MAKTARVLAMDYLARREHTRVELQRKLAQKEYSAAEIDAALDQLHQQGLQCDRRFAEQYAYYRAKRGCGPLKIKVELKQHGVSSALIDDVMSMLDVDWQVLARTVFEKKFKTTANSLQEKAKQQRFMLQRGFEGDSLQNT